MDPYLPYVASLISGLAAAIAAVWVSRNTGYVTLTVSDRDAFTKRQIAFEARMDADMQRLRTENDRLSDEVRRVTVENAEQLVHILRLEDEVRRVTTENIQLRAENAEQRLHISQLEREVTDLKTKLGWAPTD